ncbi:hypothetical protein RJT34_19085 [Clitoria ternatea]|uniref:Uncharacterized protein n=1 Tax=Clitoria ternatea TaxID=43366 RepID=A0AAN9IQD6_CLITE
MTNTGSGSCGSVSDVYPLFFEARREKGLVMFVENYCEVMLISRCQVGCFILILLSVSVLNHQVLGARFVKEETEHAHALNKYAAWRKRFKNATNGGGSYTAVKRKVPSSPDPLHNR